MDWLNRLDDVLDSALRPRKRSRADVAVGSGQMEAAKQEPPPAGTIAEDDDQKGKAWGEGFVQANHRLVSSANSKHTFSPTHVRSASSLSSQASGGGGGGMRAPGRLKRTPGRARMRPLSTSASSRTPTATAPSPVVVPPDMGTETAPSEQEEATGQSLGAREFSRPVRGMSSSNLETGPDATGNVMNDLEQSSGATDQVRESKASFMTDAVPTVVVESKPAFFDAIINEEPSNRIGVGKSIQLQSADKSFASSPQRPLTLEPVLLSFASRAAGHVPPSELGVQYVVESNPDKSLDYSESTRSLEDVPLEPAKTPSGKSKTSSEEESKTESMCKSTVVPLLPSPTTNNVGVVTRDDATELCDESPRQETKALSLQQSDLLSREILPESITTNQAKISPPAEYPADSMAMPPVANGSPRTNAAVEAPLAIDLKQHQSTHRSRDAQSLGPTVTARIGRPVVSSFPADFGEDNSILSDLQTFPQHVVFRPDFDVEHASATWDGLVDAPVYDPAMNCYGVVHVRLLRAQRLPCPVGSGVRAIVSLPPWKGRIRAKRTRSFAGSRRRGVCTDWSESDAAVSMVHAYSSEDSPVPSINIEIIFNTMGLFEFKMCNLALSCKPLICQPMIPRRQWFQTVPNGKESAENIPLLQIEAMFEPEESVTALSLVAPMEMVEVRLKDLTDDSLLRGGSFQPSSVRPRQPPSQHPSLTRNALDPLAEWNNPNESTEAEEKPEQSSGRNPAEHDLTAPDDKSDLSVSLQSYRKMRSAVSSKGHLLRTKLFYTPTSCAVCGRSIMSGIWKKQSFHCEACGVECCSDCRLQVDVSLPCGSEEAQKAATGAAQSKITSEKVLNWVAPIDESTGNTLHGSSDKPLTRSVNRLNDTEPGIGKIKLVFIEALALKTPLPPTSEVDMDLSVVQLRRGDFYVRVALAGSDRTARTRTVQRTTRPKFDSNEIGISVPHYGSEFRMELVDAADDHTIGFFLFTVQTLLQEQRDDSVRQTLLPLPVTLFRKRRVVRELRKFIKNGAASEFFVASGSKGAGEIVGAIEFEIIFEEDFSVLFGKDPYSCPARPKDDLDLSKIQAHIGRITQVVEDVRSTIQSFGYIVSWENPFLTGLSLFFFVRFCVRVHPDHVFSGPVLLGILYMMYLAFRRMQDGLKRRFLDRELSVNRKTTATLEYLGLHRPVALLKASVRGGKNLRSPEMGLPGNVSCKINLDFARFCDDQETKLLRSIDGASVALHAIGSTESVYSTSPKWRFLEESDEARRLKQVIPIQGNFFDGNGTKQNVLEIDFPILQPFARDHRSEKFKLLNWSDSKAAVVFEVVFHDLVSIFPGSEYSLGEVVIPLSKLTESEEVSGWFKITPNTTSELIPRLSQHAEEERPAIHLHLTWVPPVTVDSLPAEIEREASIVMQEEFVRAAKMTLKKSVGLVGTSLGAINTVRGFSGHLLAVQNGLGSVLDIVEASINVVNFSDPLKSSVVLAVLVILWSVLAVVPLRLIAFSIGIIPYILCFKGRFGKYILDTKQRSKSSPSQSNGKKGGSPVTIWLANFMRGVPLDEDLHKTYFWETRRAVTGKLQVEADERRSSRLRKLWRAQWCEVVEVLKSPSSSSVNPGFESAFVVIQGRRVMWWRSTNEFDSGEEPTGRILLHGHAGLATPTPIELKAIGEKDRISRAVSLFGKGADKQERITMILSGQPSKDAFEDAISTAVHMKEA